jgi:hypothetical protein
MCIRKYLPFARELTERQAPQTAIVLMPRIAMRTYIQKDTIPRFHHPCPPLQALICLKQKRFVPHLEIVIQCNQTIEYCAHYQVPIQPGLKTTIIKVTQKIIMY